MPKILVQDIVAARWNLARSGDVAREAKRLPTPGVHHFTLYYS